MARAKGTVRTNVAYALLQAFYWCAYCAFFSFLPPYLLAHGFPQATIGLVLTMLAAFSAVVPFLVGYLVDFHVPIRLCVSVALGLAVPAAFLLRATVASAPLAVLSIALLGILERSQSSVIDSWAVKLHARGVDLRYGTSRAVASVSFAVAALLLGRLFARVGLDALFIVHAAFAGLAVAAALFLQGVPVSARGASRGKGLGSTLAALLRLPRYRVLVAAVILGCAGTVPTVMFLPMRIAALGGTSADLGLSLFVMAVSESTFLLLHRRLAGRFSAERLLLVSFGAMVLRVLAATFAPSIPLLVAAHAFQALSYGLYLPAMLQYVGQIVETRVLATAVTLTVALGEGLGGVLGNAVGSAVVGTMGVRGAYLVFSACAVAAFLVFSFGQAAVVRREIADDAGRPGEPSPRGDAPPAGEGGA